MKTIYYILLLVVALIIGYSARPTPKIIDVDYSTIHESNELGKATLREVQKARVFVEYQGVAIKDSMDFLKEVVHPLAIKQLQAKYLLNAQALKGMYPHLIGSWMSNEEKRQVIDDIISGNIDVNRHQNINSSRSIYLAP